jgi:hypothetical protein
LDVRIILTIVFFVVLISIQYTLNKILLEIKSIKRVLEKSKGSDVEIEKIKKRI